MTPSPLFLALDQGGHSSRAMVFNQSGDCVAKAQVEISTRVSVHRASGEEHIEHQPEELAQSLLRCCEQVSTQLGSSAEHIQRAGLATQRSSIVGWKRSTGEAITPVISWQDRRAWKHTDALHAERATVSHLTGLVLSPHYGASKMRWCLDHDAAVAAANAQSDLTLGPLASFLVRAITDSEHNVCDPANASRSLLWDRHTRDWSPTLCALFGVDPDLLPASVPTRYDFGQIKLGAHKVPLTIVTGDQSAAIYAFGNVGRGCAFINLGTGAFMQCPVGSQPVEVEGLLNSVVYQGKHQLDYVLEGTVNGAGRALTWWGEQCGLSAKSLVAQTLEQELKDPAIAEHRMIFLNGISGLGSPYWDSDFRSRFVDAHDNEHEAKPGARVGAHVGALAILESIVFLLAENLRFARQSSIAINQVVLTGGLASVDSLCQRLADVTGLNATRSTLREATATGTGYLLSQSSRWPTLNSRSEQSSVFQPGRNPALQARFTRWKALMDQAQASRTSG